MNNEMIRKTDRRTRYTCMVIREALLELLAEKDYRNITVADICRKAEVSRGTFYRHYDHIAQILDELFDQALDKMHSVFVQIGCVTENGEQHTYPMCRFLREERRYQPLFFADSLHDYVVARLVERCKENCIEKLRNAAKLDEAALESVLLFQLSGCLAVSKRNAASTDEDWHGIQCSVDSLLKKGFQGF